MVRKKIRRIVIIVGEELALLTFELLVLIILAIACLGIFFYLSDLLIDKEIEIFDRAIFSWIDNWRSQGLTRFMKAVTFIGNREFVIIPSLIIFIYYLFIKPHRWYSIKIPVVTLGASLLNIFLKKYFERPRPEFQQLVEASGLSFPSGHAMFSFAFYGLLIYLVWQEIKNKLMRYSLTLFFLILIFLIGLSRSYLGVHYPTDVIAGFSLGLFWLILSVIVIRYIEHKISKKVKESI